MKDVNDLNNKKISTVIKNNNLDVEIKLKIEEFIKYNPNKKLSMGRDIYLKESSEKLIEEFIDKWRFEEISKFKQLSEEFINKYEDRLYWENLAYYQKNLSEEFLERHINKLRYDDIFKYQILSEEFIEKHIDKVYGNWMYISQYQTLSEEFIEKYSNKVYSDYILKYQELSLEFIKTNYNIKDIDYNNLLSNNKIKDNNIWLYIYKENDKYKRENIIWLGKHTEFYNTLVKIKRINEDKNIKTEIDLFSKRYSNYSYEDLLKKIEKIESIKEEQLKNKKLREEQLKKMKDENKKVKKLIIDENLDEDLVF